MKIFRADQVRQIDAYTIEHEPIRSIDLMERAALQLYTWISERYSQCRRIRIFIGPGNNGGDGLALARMMAGDFYRVEVFYARFTDQVSPDWQVNYDRLIAQGSVSFTTLESAADFPDPGNNDLVIDGLFGSGLSRPLTGFPAEVVHYLNRYPAEIVAIDMPSGLFGDDNTENNLDAIVRADQTLTFQFPTLSFFYAENEPFTGRWHLLPIGLHPEIIDQLQTSDYYLTPEFIRLKLHKRKKFAHKGHFGHVLLISGSYGRMGAAVLASRACLRTGTGLVTVHVPVSGHQIIQTAVPEAMISFDDSDVRFSVVPDLTPYQAIGIGPALGCDRSSQKALYALMKEASVPLVFDADAINILGSQRAWLKSIPVHSILTPHPKEFERLAGHTDNHYEQNRKQVEFSKEYQVYLVLKGAYTSVSCPDGTCYFNTTGNPGMATAGSGDVLTGIILSLLGQGYTPEISALTGVYLHGLAGDIARDRVGEEALIATDIIESLGEAFTQIKATE